MVKPGVGSELNGDDRLARGPGAGPTRYYSSQRANEDGTRKGADQSFTTAAAPAPPALAPILPTPPLLPVPSVTPPGKTSGSGSGGKQKKRSGSSKKLAKALKACAKKAKGKRVACERQARKRYGSRSGRPQRVARARAG